MSETITTQKGRVKILITSLSGSLVTVERRHPSGRVFAVRGMTLAPLSGGAFIGWDYEAPIGVQVTYTATTYADPDTALTSSDHATITWTSDADWLKDPLEPARNLPVRIADMSEYDYATPTGVHTVLGRPEPITVSDVRQAATGDVTLYTETKDERDRLHYITASGHTLLLQSTQESGVGNMYIQPLGVKEARVVPLRSEPARLWTLSYAEVGIPAGEPGAFSTWQDAADAYASWQSIADSFETWLAFVDALDNTTNEHIVAYRGA